ncbi:hypothetical protein KY334_04285 [Candidatus Woesearchaeota archaeon]|nr:hypothetical protein [Candidatus Woesearchaeota archaeon]
MENQETILINAANKYSSDYDLGEYLNLKYRDSLSGDEMSELVKNNPNYYQLGKLARSMAISKLYS